MIIGREEERLTVNACVYMYVCTVLAVIVATDYQLSRVGGCSSKECGRRTRLVPRDDVTESAMALVDLHGECVLVLPISFFLLCVCVRACVCVYVC